MGTRSTLQFNSKEHELTIVLYRHWDGYPSSNLDSLYKAIKQSNDLESLIDNFVIDYDTDYKGNRADQRTLDNMTEYVGPYQSNLYDTNQGDLEWCYVVDFDNKNIEVYGGGYGTQFELSANGLTNPYKEVDCYVESAQENYRKFIAEALTDLAALGWTVNANTNENQLSA